MSAQSVPPRPRFLVASTLLAVVLTALLVGCSGEDRPGDAGSTPDDAAVQSSTRSLPRGTGRTTVRVGEVAGRLSQRDRARVRAEVGRVVDRWWKAAWWGPDYPRTRIRDPFPGFTADAARLARRESRTMTAAAVSRRIGGVVPRQRAVTVDVLAPGGRAAAATARFRLGLGAWDRRLAERIGVVRVTGRLFLAPTGRGWRVFGFRVSEDRPRALLPQRQRQGAQKEPAGKKPGKKPGQKPGQKPAKKKERGRR